MRISTTPLTAKPNGSKNSVMDTAIATFLARCDAYRLSLEPPISRARLGSILFSDARKLDALEAGSDIGVRRMALAESALAALERASQEKEAA